MRYRMGVICLMLSLAAAVVRADSLPEPDQGPLLGSVGGLEFEIQRADVRTPAGTTLLGHKGQQMAVLVGCTEGHPNCTLAVTNHAIGMEVLSINGQRIDPKRGRIQQILDAFDSKTTDRTVTLEMYLFRSNIDSVPIEFQK
jgi:hypothetical protein